ncbi:MAG: DUF6049 family protein [Candidatus Phosphoribacter baldrii]
MRLAARVVALVAAACGSLAVPGMPPATASPASPVTASPPAAPASDTFSAASAFPVARRAPSTSALSTPDLDPGSAVITLDSIAPAVLKPGDPLLVTGSVGPPSAPGSATTAPSSTTAPNSLDDQPAVIRLVRSRIALATRSEVDDWAASTGPAQGTELARHTLDPTGPGGQVPFRLTAPAEDLRLPRAYGAIPIAVEVLSARGTSIAVIRTFVGWQRSKDYVPLALAWLLPVTLAPDPALSATAAAARTSAWNNQVGPTSHLTALLSATAAHTVGYAVDPAVLGPVGQANAQDPADPADPIRAGFEQALRAASARHPVFALPYADPDLGALTSPALPADTASKATAFLHDLVGGSGLLSQRGVTVAGTLAWPADGTLPQGREAALRTAYGASLDAILVSAGATDPTARLTPPTAGLAPLQTPVLRWDDRLSGLVSGLRTPSDGLLAGQQFIAQTVALLGERPSIARTFLVVPPRGFDATVAPEVMSRFLDATAQVPWVRTVSCDSALRPGPGLDAAPPLPTAPEDPSTPVTRAGIPSAGNGTGSGTGAGLDASRLTRILDQRATITALAELLGGDSPTIARLTDLPAQVTSTRWRADPAGRDVVLGELEQATTSLTDGVTVTPQTTNFLADEGVLQLTVVNSLDEPVTGVRAVLAPGNGRLVVIEPGAPVDIAAHAKATVSVRLAAVAQGLVPVNAWVTTASGTRIGSVQQLTIRAAPPGAWLYVGMGGLFALVLIAGVVRAVRRPPRQVVDTRGLDPVDPTPEEPLVAPVERHTAP